MEEGVSQRILLSLERASQREMPVIHDMHLATESPVSPDKGEIIFSLISGALGGR
jgi:hypothetical protein